MEISTRAMMLAVAAIGLGTAAPTVAESQTLTATECQRLRERLAAHAALSPGVRQALAARPASQPAPVAAVQTPQPVTGGTEAIQRRLSAIATERRTLEPQRLAALASFEFSKAAGIQGQIQSLDAERAQLEAELQKRSTATTSAPSQPATTTPATTTPAMTADVDRVACQDLPATLERAVTIRQRELGAREGQAGAVPLTALTGRGRPEIARELDAQLGPWPAAASRVGLLDQDGDGRIEGFVDAPVEGIYRVYRERSDGSVSLEIFAHAANATSAYAETVRSLDEETARRTQRRLPDLLAVRAAGPVRVVGRTGAYEEADKAFRAGDFTKAAVDGGAAKSVEFPNYRGQMVRVTETIAPGADGSVVVREATVLPAASGQERWEETATQVRSRSYWQTEVQVVVTRETREAGTGRLVGAPSVPAPIQFTLSR